MSTNPPTEPDRRSPELGSRLVALAGAGILVYGVVFLIRNFTGFIELGLTPQHVGGTPAQIQAFSPRLFYYISHLQTALAGSLMAIGVAVIGLAWFGIRGGQRWAVWTALVAPVIALVVGLPLHYVYGLATLGHLGLIYVDVTLLFLGVALARRALAR